MNHMDKDGRMAGAWFDRNGFRPAPYTPGRMVTSIRVHTAADDDPGRLAGTAKHTLRMLGIRTADTPLRFSTAFFRHPRPIGECGDGAEDAGNGWNCRWIEWSATTDADGERRRYKCYPKRLQFNLPYLRNRLLRGRLLPMLHISFRPAFPGMDGSPMVTHLDRMFDMLNLVDAERDRLLVDDPREAEPGVFALIEHTTGVVIPVAAGCHVELTVEVDDPDAVHIRVCEPWAMTEPPQSGGEGSSRYSWPNEFDDAEARADIDRWCRQLKELVARREGPEYAALRNDIERLKERMTRDDLLNA